MQPVPTEELVPDSTGFVMTIHYMYPSMPGPTFTEQLPSLRALHIHPTQTYLSEPTLYDAHVIGKTSVLAPGPPPPSEASQLSSDDSETFSTPMSLCITPLSSPRTSVAVQHGSARLRKRRSSSSSDSVDSRYYEERGKVQCQRATETIKSEKKAAKERAHRDGEAFYRQTQEDVFVNYFAFRPSSKLAKGNKTSSGLEYPKATMQRASIVVSVKLIDDNFRLAVKEGRIDEWQAEWQQWIEDHIGDDEHLLEGSLLDIPNEPRCCHANSKEQSCTTHGHKDWTECRRSRYRTAFHKNARAYQHRMAVEGTSNSMY